MNYRWFLKNCNVDKNIFCRNNLNDFHCTTSLPLQKFVKLHLPGRRLKNGRTREQNTATKFAA